MPPSAPIRVMLVDDHGTVLWGLQQLIDSQKPRMEVVATATDGAGAIRNAREAQPDVVLLDVDLGESNGLDILPELIVCQKGAVLMLTGVRDQAILDQAIMSGARGVISKQVQPELLLHAIETVCSGQLWLDRTTAGRVVLKQRLADEQNRSVRARLARLTPKERAVLQAVVQHAQAPNKVLAGVLCMSEHTLRNHLAALYQKLDVKNRVALYLFATENISAAGEPGR